MKKIDVDDALLCVTELHKLTEVAIGRLRELKKLKTKEIVARARAPQSWDPTPGFLPKGMCEVVVDLRQGQNRVKNLTAAFAKVARGLGME